MEIPKGLCQCGCGGKTAIAKRNHAKNGHIKGEPIKYLQNHQARMRRHKHHRWAGGRYVNNRGYVMIHNSEHPRATSLGWVPEHILIAEKALGKFLEMPHVVHHHTPEQLVVCEDQAYHMFIHQRQRAYEACGHPNWQRCSFCKSYDDPINMVAKGAHAIHRQCRDEYNRVYRQKIKEAL